MDEGGGVEGQRRSGGTVTVPGLVLRRVGELVVESIPEPELAPGEVRLAPVAVGICASDVHGYAGHNDRRAAGVVMGHEAAGTIVAIGPGVELETGALVALNPVVVCGDCPSCRAGATNVCVNRRLYGCALGLPGAFAGSMAVRARNVVPLAAGTPVESAALCEPLAVGTHAAAVAQAGPGRRVVVVGGGIIGLGAALASRRRGADHVAVAEPDSRRREVAERLGFEAFAPDAAKALFDVAIEAVGHPASMALALSLTPIRGEVVVVGLADSTIQVPASALVMDERRICGSAVYTEEEFLLTARAVERGEADLSPIVQDRVALEQLPEVFAEYASGARDAMRTIMRA